MSLTDDIERLRAIPLLSVLDDEGLRLLAFNAEKKSASDAQSIFFIGDPASGALLIMDGFLSQMELVGGEMKERRRLSVGTIVDPYALISETRRTYTGKAFGELTYMVLERASFLKVMENYPDLAERVQDYLSDDIADVTASFSKVASRLDCLN